MIRMAILDAYDHLLDFLDNSVPDAAHYYDSSLTEYLTGMASTLELTVLSQEEASQNLKVGNKLAFIFDGKEYYLNIRTVERNSLETQVSADGLSFELLCEDKGPYNSGPKTIIEHIKAQMGERDFVKFGINEIPSTTQIALDFTDTETNLKRLYAIADAFNAEIIFKTHLKPTYALDYLEICIYDKNPYGAGSDRTAETIHYGEHEGVEKTEDITDLFTAIVPLGASETKDKVTTTVSLQGYSNTASDGNGSYTADGSGFIRAVDARRRFPSVLRVDADGNLTDSYIVRHMTFSDAKTQEELWKLALDALKKGSVPQVSYKIKGYVDGEVGDRFTIADESYSIPIYVEARITEQKYCLDSDDTSQNETTFDNFTEVKSELSSSITKQINDLVEASKVYGVTIASTNGTAFKNGEGSTTLQAQVWDGAAEVTDGFNLTWYKDGNKYREGKTADISGSDFLFSCVLRVEATKGGTVRGMAEVTLTNLFDGVDGKDAVVIKYLSSRGYSFKNNNAQTTLSIVITVGSKRITDSTAMKQLFGDQAEIRWYQLRLGNTEWERIPANDSRLSDNGFIFVLSSGDIDEKLDVRCELLA